MVNARELGVWVNIGLEAHTDPYHFLGIWDAANHLLNHLDNNSIKQLKSDQLAN